MDEGTIGHSQIVLQSMRRGRVKREKPTSCNSNPKPESGLRKSCCRIKPGGVLWRDKRMYSASYAGKIRCECTRWKCILPPGQAMGDGSFSALMAEATRYIGYPLCMGR